MENTSERSTLNAEIENLSEQLRKIKENNAILKSLDEEKKKLSDMENSFFSSKNSLHIILFNKEQYPLNCQLLVVVLLRKIDIILF